MLYFIVNQTARSGKSTKVWKKVKKCLNDSMIECRAYETKYKGHATKMAEKLSELPDEQVALVVVGGDGTINEVLNGIRDFDKIQLGIIPAGSGNDFAKGLKIEKDPVANITQIALHAEIGNVRNVDLGMAIYPGCKTPKVFGISSGIGLDAEVCKKALTSTIKRVFNFFHMGKLTYLFLTVTSLFTMKVADVNMKLEKEIKETNHRLCMDKSLKNVIFIASMNLRAEGGGVPMAPKATGNNGCLAISSASQIPKWKTFFCLPLLVAGKQEKVKGFETQYTHKGEFICSRPMVLHADGEYCGEVTRVTYECLPGLLKLLN